MSRLLKMLEYRRPFGSKTEREFVSRYIDSIPDIRVDSYGNRCLIHPTSKTIIACHTDTVHRLEGKQRVWKSGNTVVLHRRERGSNCLGADDTAGVYACLRMIEAKVPATFIFHRAEEVGGLGSRHLADAYPDWLKTFKRCISLDRRGTTDVIEYQSWSRCCSNTFAKALGSALGMGHKPADGIFTDSANYTRLIPECSNLSVGYEHEHTAAESLNVDYLERLIVRLCAIDWEALPTERDPSVIETDDWGLDGWTFGYSGARYGCSVSSVSSKRDTRITRVESNLGFNPDVTDYDVAVLCDYCAADTTVTYNIDGFEICPDCMDREYTYEERDAIHSNTDLYEALLCAGIKISHHESDLYFPVSPESKEILATFPLQRSNATTFVNRVEGGLWFDVPFSYTPWWESRTGASSATKEPKP